MSAAEINLPDSPSRIPGVALAVLAILALLLRAVTLRESLWVDELHTAWCVDAPWAQVASRARAGNQPPLYFWLLWCLSQFWGLSEWSLRLPSLLAGTGSLLIAAALVHAWTRSRSLCLLTGLLIALDPQAIDYAREARPYACVQWLGLLQVLCFLRLQQDDCWRIRLAWILLSWLMFYCHFTSGLLLLGEVCYVIGAWPWRRWPLRRDVVGWLWDLSLIAAGMLVAWSPLAEIAARRENWARFVPQAPWTEIVRLFAAQVYVLAPALVVGMLAGLWYACGVRWKPRPQLLPALLFCFCWYGVPVLTAWLLTQQDWARLMFRRYLIVVGLVPMIVGGVLGGLLPPGRSRWVYVAFTSMLAVLWLTPTDPLSPDALWRRHRREDWRSAVEWINQDPQAGRFPVYLRPGLIEDDALRETPSAALRDFCLFPLRGLYQLQPDPPALFVLPCTRSWQLNDAQLAALRQAGGGWLILRQRPRPAAETLRRLQRFLRAAGCPAAPVRQRSFGYVAVILLQVNGVTVERSHTDSDLPALPAR